MSDPVAALPGLDEARAWVGWDLDEAGGARVGTVERVYADAESGAPAWLAVALPGGGGLRRRRGKSVVVPLRECAAMPGRVWTAEPGAALRGAPAVDPARPLLREHEAAICEHYGIGPAVGRHAEVAGRPAGAETARPAHPPGPTGR